MNRRIVLNRCYGGFSLSDWAVKMLGLSSPYDDIARDNKTLVAMVELYPTETAGRCAQLEVVKIPVRATDWQIFEYDGMETLVVVVDGKIVTM